MNPLIQSCSRENTTVCKFNNSNIGTVNAIQEKFVYQTEISLLIKTLFFFLY